MAMYAIEQFYHLKSAPLHIPQFSAHLSQSKFSYSRKFYLFPVIGPLPTLFIEQIFRHIMNIHTLDLHFLDIPEAIAAYLIETEAGPVLVETGPHSALNGLKAGLKAHGYQLSDIEHVFLTHIHLDHAGAAWALAEAGAKIHVHPFGYRHLASPEKLMQSAKRIYQDDMDRLWGEMRPIPEEKLQAVENEAEFLIGDAMIKAWHTPGHAVHHIAWQVGKVLFTGDVAGVKIGRGMVVPPCPPPDINIEDWLASLVLIRQMEPKALYLTHFGKIGDLHYHLDHLEKQLMDWAAWMRIKFEQKIPSELIVPEFQTYTANQLKENGADDLLLKQYEAANPTWMSVAGLMRYWKKKLDGWMSGWVDGRMG